MLYSSPSRKGDGEADGELLKEELKLQAVVDEENRHHMNFTISEARRQSSQYQREADKCNAATEACEEARERAEQALKLEKKATAAWELRARQLGWPTAA
ncbi:unnamed protein product [Spirodela intermedia]|uniref:Uncharacterized protein n=1 Tax=Spirodela intermedia TaxID=51605 RepID=A0A7I8JKC5_SPIIN|nr:unnamed protein product [Spirodela intermedia]CAA6670235.1 unnamed protein product [Spirodela intermedia]